MEQSYGRTKEACNFALQHLINTEDLNDKTLSGTPPRSYRTSYTRELHKAGEAARPGASPR